MSWLILVVAGLLEVSWASALSASENFSKPIPTVIFFVTLALSMFGLSRAMIEIPLGTAYAVWVGIGVVGAVTYGVVRNGDPMSPAKVVFLGLLVVSIAGLRVTTQ